MRNSPILHKFSVMLIVIALLVGTNIGLSPVAMQSDVLIDCAVETNESLPFEGSLLVHVLDGEQSQFLFVDGKGNTAHFGTAPDDFRSFYDPINSLVLIWTNAPEANANRESFQFTIMSLETGDVLESENTLTDSYRPVQWLDNNRFLFSNSLDDSFQIFSVEKGQLEPGFRSDEFPDMRLIPLIFKQDYDFSVSRNGRYVAYENESINRGIVLWDTETNSEIKRFVTEMSGIAVANPVWSHDSTKIALALFVETEMQLFVFDVNTGGTHQITDFDTGLPEFGRPFATINDIFWSPNDKYIAFNGTLEHGGLHIFDTESKTVTNVCVDKAPVFWMPSGNALVLYGDPIQILDVEAGLVYTVPVSGRAVGATSLSIDSLIGEP